MCLLTFSKVCRTSQVCSIYELGPYPACVISNIVYNSNTLGTLVLNQYKWSEEIQNAFRAVVFYKVFWVNLSLPRCYRIKSLICLKRNICLLILSQLFSVLL